MWYLSTLQVTINFYPASLFITLSFPKSSPGPEEYILMPLFPHLSKVKTLKRFREFASIPLTPKRKFCYSINMHHQQEITQHWQHEFHWLNCFFLIRAAFCQFQLCRSASSLSFSEPITRLLHRQESLCLTSVALCLAQPRHLIPVYLVGQLHPAIHPAALQ